MVNLLIIINYNLLLIIRLFEKKINLKTQYVAHYM